MITSIRIIPHMCAVYRPHPIGYGYELGEYTPLKASSFSMQFDRRYPYDRVEKAVRKHLSIEHDTASDIHTHNGYIIAHSPRSHSNHIVCWSYRVEIDGKSLDWGEFPDIFPDFIHDWSE